MPGEFRPSVPGERRGGRVKGTPNKTSATIKEMVMDALCDVGGRKYLAEQAIKNPNAFLGLVGRVMPLQVTGEDGGALMIDFRWAEPEPVTIEAELDAAPLTVTFATAGDGEQ